MKCYNISQSLLNLRAVGWNPKICSLKVISLRSKPPKKMRENLSIYFSFISRF